MSEPARKLPLPSVAEPSPRAQAEREAERRAAWAEYSAWADAGPGGPLTAAEIEAAERELASACAD